MFRAVGPGAALVRPVHETVTRGVYAGLGMGTRGRHGRGRRGRTPPGPPISSTPLGGAAIAAITGLTGDKLEEEGSPLAQPMAVRVGGEPGRARARRARGGVPGRDSAARRLPARPDGDRVLVGARETYGARLERDLGYTPVYVRYNSGLRISQNGRCLSELLEELVAAWPVEVERIALVGHSMGGLVARSACYRGVEDGAGLGAARAAERLARHAAHGRAARAGRALPERRPRAAARDAPVRNFLRRRSGGIRDLRQGSLVDEDWRDCDPDALRAAACAEVPLLEGATHCFVSATVTRSDRHPLGRLLGDTLVLKPSATGRSRTRRIPFEEEFGMHLGGAHHFALLNHPAVYEKLRAWLAKAA